MAPASDTAQSKGVTIVTQTRVAPDSAADFESWQRNASRIIATQPGFVQQTVLPPSPPTQLDWVILQRFSNNKDALSWVRSNERERLLAEVRPILIGQDDVHFVEDASGVLPAPASAVISTRIKPGQERPYREWERKIAAAQARAPGFQGYRFEPPVSGLQEDWLAILRFDSEANLEAWLASPERAKLLDEARSFTDEYRTRIARTGFDQWFRIDNSIPSAPAWKQNMIVLMLLFPVVILFNAGVQSPLLVERLGLPLWGALFIGNAVSVVLLSLLVPWASRWLDWWLSPSGGSPKTELGGVALVLAIYVSSLLLAWRLS
ncbi:MAG: antibiotic biosynthesis monooxygenase [Hyphomicrobium sp.]|nr:MAG: antibiotic biosynthesis monooxygenase [Hyphomicrobium sp.]